MKNLSQRVMRRVSIVAVALMSAGTPSEVYRVVMVISGIPTSKGMPRGIDLTAKTIVDVIRTTPHETGYHNDMKTRYGMLKLKNQVIAR
jgi:hypothetical protein